MTYDQIIETVEDAIELIESVEEDLPPGYGSAPNMVAALELLDSVVDDPSPGEQITRDD